MVLVDCMALPKSGSWLTSWQEPLKLPSLALELGFSWFCKDIPKEICKTYGWHYIYSQMTL